MATEKVRIDRFLTSLVSNGAIEIGLEVGADPGLSEGEYIRIPRLMKVGFVASERPNEVSDTATVTGKPDDKGKGKEYKGDMVYLNDNKYYAAVDDGTGRYARGARLTGVRANDPASWTDEIKAFIAANEGHVREPDLTPSQVLYAHCIRYWSVKAGMVVTSKSREYVEVADPSADKIAAVPDSSVSFVAERMGQALTACSARVASWRKSNHATGAGGSGLAAGFPRRWLAKESIWTEGSDRARVDAANRQATTMFYIATHATSVHGGLALMVPADKHHWAVLSPKYGLMKSWDIRESTAIRLTPRTQVAGAAMVTDAVEVAKMMVSEGLSGILTNAGSLQRLATLAATVATEGMRVAVYAKWFFDGHHEDITRVPFNQKDPAASALIGELATVAVKFYAGTTISQSPSLANASSQMATPADLAKWASIARAKSGAVSATVLAAYGRLSGASAAKTVEDLASKDEAVVRTAVATYQGTIDTHAQIFGITTYTRPSADQVVSAMAAADARADEIAKLAV